MVGLNDDAGFNKIQSFISIDKVKKCRQACVTTYPINVPIVLPPPPTDPDLGLMEEYPAKSCMDIVKWGGKPDTGVKYIEVGQ